MNVKVAYFVCLAKDPDRITGAAVILASGYEVPRIPAAGEFVNLPEELYRILLEKCPQRAEISASKTRRVEVCHIYHNWGCTNNEVVIALQAVLVPP